MITKKKAPYASTTKDVDSSIAEINKLLRSFGIQNMQWTTLWEVDHVELRFALEVSPGALRPIRIEPPRFMTKRRSWNSKKGMYETIEAPNWPQSLRLVYWWLKTKLEAVAYGLREAEMEFLGDILVKLPTGEETTMGKALKGQLPSGNGTNAISIPIGPGGEP